MKIDKDLTEDSTASQGKLTDLTNGNHLFQDYTQGYVFSGKIHNIAIYFN